jgi:hypothetical protein
MAGLSDRRHRCLVVCQGAQLTGGGDSCSRRDDKRGNHEPDRPSASAGASPRAGDAGAYCSLLRTDAKARVGSRYPVRVTSASWERSISVMLLTFTLDSEQSRSRRKALMQSAGVFGQDWLEVLVGVAAAVGTECSARWPRQVLTRARDDCA